MLEHVMAVPPKGAEGYLLSVCSDFGWKCTRRKSDQNFTPRWSSAGGAGCFTAAGAAAAASPPPHSAPQLLQNLPVVSSPHSLQNLLRPAPALPKKFGAGNRSCAICRTPPPQVPGSRLGSTVPIDSYSEPLFESAPLWSAAGRAASERAGSSWPCRWALVPGLTHSAPLTSSTTARGVRVGSPRRVSPTLKRWSELTSLAGSVVSCRQRGRVVWRMAGAKATPQ